MRAANHTYTVRANAFTPAKTYRLTSDGLTIAAEGDETPRTIRWGEIVAVDLVYAATRYAGNRRLCRLQLRNGAREELVSCSYEGFAKFRDQATAFNAFVRALHEALVTHGNAVRFGREASAWARHGRLAVAAGLTLAVLGLAVAMSLHGVARGWLVVKLFVLVAMLPPLLRWAGQSRGGRYDPCAIPAERLPEEQAPPASKIEHAKSTSGPGRIWRIIVAGLLLWLLWVEWRPHARAWPTELARPQTAEELDALATGREFLIQGRVEPLPGLPPREWQGRFVFRHRQRQDDSGGGGKTVRLVTVAEHRPALRWVWAGGSRELAAEGYGIDYAPRIEPRFWPRKNLWLSRVDDWDRSSTGFRVGETALALGRIGADGSPEIVDLLPGELEQAGARWQQVERPRVTLIFAVKLVFTLGLLGWALRRSANAD